MKFQNAVMALPPDIKAEVDSLVENNCSGRSLYFTLKEKYKETAQIPSIPTLLKYIKYYHASKQQVQRQVVEEKMLTKLEGGIVEVDRVLIQISKGEDPSFNKIHLLEGLAGKCLKRIQNLENMVSTYKDPDPAVENVIVRYVSTVKEIVQSVVTLANESQDDQVLIQMIRAETSGILRAVNEVLLDLCPDKYEEFKEKLKTKLSGYTSTDSQGQTSIPALSGEVTDAETESPAVPIPESEPINQTDGKEHTI
jgi:hypothetical protein